MGRRVRIKCGRCRTVNIAAEVPVEMARRPGDELSSLPASCSRQAAPGGWASRSSCCPTDRATLLDHVLGTARSCRVRPAPVRDRRRGRRGARHRGLRGRSRWSRTRSSAEGCSSSIAAALGAVDPRCEVLVLMLGDQPGVTAENVADAARAAAATRRSPPAATPTAAVTRSRSRARSSPSFETHARRQGRLEAARPPRGRSRRRSRGRRHPAGHQHVGGLRGASPASCSS